jgi:RHS repeat-associated protein
VLNENGPDGNIDFQYGLSLLSGSSPTLEQFYQTDGMGSTADVTDGTDSLKASYTYDPWGKLLNPIDPLGTKDKFKFTGEALDPQTGLYYLRARYYDPAVATFLSKDRFAGFARAPITTNYSYADGNPLKYTDHSGMATEGFNNGDISVLPGPLSPVSQVISSFAFAIPLPGNIWVGPREPTDPPPDPFDPSGHLPGPPPGINYPQIPHETVPTSPGEDLGNAVAPPQTWPSYMPGAPFSNILDTATCSIFDVCSAPDTQAPLTPGQIDNWNNTSDTWWSDTGSQDTSGLSQ